MQEQALIPNLLATKERSWSFNATVVGVGVFFLAVLAQVAIPLPFTPVPITGQTFGVALMSLLFGRKLGIATVASYLIIGASGVPIFAGASFGLTWGPTLGYLIGMFFAAYAVGSLADRGWTRSWLHAYLAATCGSVIIFSCGMFVLSFFLPSHALITAGFLPFLPGDIIKNSLAAAIAVGANRVVR